MRSFFRGVSGGLVDYENEVFGFYRAPHSFTYYDSLPYAAGARLVLGEALNWLDNQGFDFSTLTLNEDNTIRAINLMYTGEPTTWAKGMWHHKGTYSEFVSNSGIGSFDYNCSLANSPLGIGVVAHENGHMIGKWPDTYKYSSNNGPDGIGAFDLMCWYGSSENPVPPNPLFCQNAGWGKTIDVSNWNTLIYDTANSLTRYQYRNPNDTNEFYLFENRKIAGRSSFIPDAGLTIWHIDRNGNNQTRHHEVKLVNAYNDSISQNRACFRGPVKPQFSLATNPDSKWYSGDESGLRLWSISTRANVMNYKIGSGVPSSNLKIRFSGVSSDNNQNGFPESGETIKMDWEFSNVGQLPSGPCSITCTTLGVNASLAVLSNGVQNIGTLQVDSILKKFFEIQISPLATAGDEITFRVQISDGTQSISVSKKILIGLQINMIDFEDSTCQGLYFDPNGIFEYDNSSDVVHTLYPQSQGQKVRVQFLDFVLEDQSVCGYDYLKIHNGPSQVSPLLGKWCGINSPGTLTSTHSSGALTFVFHSDDGVTAQGWKAKISCFSSVMNANLNSKPGLFVYPNPGDGVFFFSNPDQIKKIRVFDVMGRELIQTTFDSGSKKSVDLSTLSGSVFWLSIEVDGGSWMEKVFKNQ